MATLKLKQDTMYPGLAGLGVPTPVGSGGAGIADVNSLISQSSALDGQIRSLTGQINSLNSQISGRIDSLKKVIADKKAKVSSLTKQRNDLQTKVNAMNSDLKKRGLAGLGNPEITNLISSVDGLSSDISNLETEIAMLTKELKELMNADREIAKVGVKKAMTTFVKPNLGYVVIGGLVIFGGVKLVQHLATEKKGKKAA